MDINEIKKQLLSDRHTLEDRLERTHKHIFHKDEAISPNFHEQVVQTENDQLVYALDHEGQSELNQINEALRRIEAGSYTQCSKCGEPIGEQRLEAIPYTSSCISCAR
jgi:DnaK suppressor protein